MTGNACRRSASVLCYFYLRYLGLGQRRQIAQGRIDVHVLDEITAQIGVLAERGFQRLELLRGNSIAGIIGEQRPQVGQIAHCTPSA